VSDIAVTFSHGVYAIRNAIRNREALELRSQELAAASASAGANSDLHPLSLCSACEEPRRLSNKKSHHFAGNNSILLRGSFAVAGEQRRGVTANSRIRFMNAIIVACTRTRKVSLLGFVGSLMAHAALFISDRSLRDF